MSAMSRFGPSVARIMVAQQHRQMASVSTTQINPIQKLFLDKIKEFKTSSKGLDEKHQKLMNEEMKRLARVYKVDDENKLAQIDCNFSSETEISLHDLDATKELREKIYSGEYQKQLAAQPAQKSELLESIPYREPDEFHLPLINKPHKGVFYEFNDYKLHTPKLQGHKADYEITGESVSPDSIQKDLRTVFGEKMPTIDDDKSPQRDLVNFPRQPQLLDTPPTVAHIIPYSWFKFFYPKTGVTGPYAFGVGFTTFLLSKELLVMEHELISGLSMILLFAYLLPKFGPQVSGFFRKEVQAEVDEWDRWQKENIKVLGELKESITKQLKKGPLLDELYDARKQDVDAQLELEYRRRLKAVYEDTKRRLNYLVAVADSKRGIYKSHMVNWVIENVNSSVGPKLEEEYLNNCIVNLKQLAQKNLNTI